MGRAKQQFIEREWFLAKQEDEESESALRLSMTCHAMVRKLGYPLYARLVELSHLLLEPNVEFRRVG